MRQLDLELIRTMLSYDFETGDLTWISNSRNSMKAGRVVNRPQPDGYLYVKCKNQRFCAHRVAWALHYGEWPATPLDHINMNRSDNRISNLRLASVTENNRNRVRQRNNTSGHKGVSLHKPTGKYVAKLTTNKVTKHLGTFSTLEEAGAAYQAAAKEMHGEFANY